MKYLLSLDQGTTSSRAVLFDQHARIVAADQYEFPQIFPKAGWVEHDPEEIWASQWKAIEGAFNRAGCGWEMVEAIGVTNQRETIVAWDAETGIPLRRAIVWQDRRTADFCSELKAAGREDWIQKKTGLLLDPYFSATKMRWLLRNDEEVRAAAAEGRLNFGTIDSWLVWKLSAGKAHVTDVSNASRTLLMDLRGCAWDDELLDLFGVPRRSLPRIVDSSGRLAETAESLTDHVVPICGIAGDQQAALFGQLCFDPGMAKNTYGTGCFILMQVGSEPVWSKNKLLSTVAWRIGGKTEYALEGSVFVAGAAVQWLRDKMGLIDKAAEIEILAASEDDSGGVVVVPSFTGLGAPHWDPQARGAILGLTRGSSVGHVARACLEGIAMQVVDVVRAMERDSGKRLAAMRADGGASANGSLMHLQADLSGTNVVCPLNLETTAMGAAFLAGLGAGYWSSKDELRELVAEDRSYAPEIGEADRERVLARWKRAVAAVRSFGDGGVV